MTRTVESATAAFQPTLPLAVALSGGADSVALLAACVRKWPGQVVAWHINHGLQEAAAAFEQHCQVLCAAWHVPLSVRRVQAFPQPGQSPEDAARQARYQAFDGLAPVEYDFGAIKSVAIAQHADDQVETLLLALSRGAGLAGLAAMPARWQRGGVDYHRPWLAVAGADVRDWATQQGLNWVDDPTNADQRYTRNRIRARLLPVLQEVFPQFRDTFARSATLAAQAQALLDGVARQDLQALDGGVGGRLPLRPLQAMDRARQAQVVRYWLKATYGTIPSAAQLHELLDQVAACTTRGHRIHIKVGEGFVHGSRQGLAWCES